MEVQAVLRVPTSRLHRDRQHAQHQLHWNALAVFIAPATERQFRCDAWVARSLMEAAVVAALMAVHIVEFCFYMARTRAMGRLAPSLVPYDGLALLLGAALLGLVASKRSLIRSWRHDARPQHVPELVVATTPRGAGGGQERHVPAVEPSQGAAEALQASRVQLHADGAADGAATRDSDASAAARGAATRGSGASAAAGGAAAATAVADADVLALWYVTSGWHAFHVGLFVVLTASRYSYFSVIACTDADAAIGVSTCTANEDGVMPVNPILQCTVILTAFVTFLAETEAAAYCVITTAFALAIAASLALTFAMGAPPTATTVGTYLVLVALACAILATAARYVVRTQR
jgi:hypothetical protein